MKFVAKYRCQTCGAEVILIRSFDDISSGRDWQNITEKRGCTCVNCHSKGPNARQHDTNCMRAAAYARHHCWPDLIGDEDTIMEAELVRMNVAGQIKNMLKFREISYVTTSFLGDFLAQHRDAAWWLRREDGKSQVKWAEEYARYCDERCIDLVRVYLRYLNQKDRKIVDDYIINTPYMKAHYPAIYIQNRMRKGWPIDT